MKGLAVSQGAEAPQRVLIGVSAARNNESGAAILQFELAPKTAGMPDTGPFGRALRHRDMLSRGDHDYRLKRFGTILSMVSLVLAIVFWWLASKQAQI
jgi:hypothetical protein